MQDLNDFVVHIEDEVKKKFFVDSEEPVELKQLEKEGVERFRSSEKKKLLK